MNTVCQTKTLRTRLQHKDYPYIHHSANICSEGHLLLRNILVEKTVLILKQLLIPIAIFYSRISYHSTSLISLSMKASESIFGPYDTPYLTIPVFELLELYISPLCMNCEYCKTSFPDNPIFCFLYK